MGSSQTKDKNVIIPSDKVVENLKNKVGILQGEINDIMCMRDDEIQAYDREMVVFAFKEAEWKKERKKLREELKKLRKRVGDKEMKVEGMEDEEIGEKCVKEGQLSGHSYLLEQIREEQARRDDAVEKWKQLYFAIKIELDDLIQRTNQGEEGLCWKAEEEAMLEELHRELAAKDETTAHLQAQLAAMKQEELKRQSEVDILRQSLRIMCYNKKVNKHK